MSHAHNRAALGQDIPFKLLLVDFFRFFGILSLILFTSLRFPFSSHSSYCVLRFERKKKMLLNGFLWIAQSRFSSSFKSPFTFHFLLINYHDLDYFSSFYVKFLFVNYKVSTLAAPKRCSCYSRLNGVDLCWRNRKLISRWMQSCYVD